MDDIIAHTSKFHLETSILDALRDKLLFYYIHKYKELEEDIEVLKQKEKELFKIKFKCNIEEIEYLPSIPTNYSTRITFTIEQYLDNYDEN
jgi:hypothetical protein